MKQVWITGVVALVAGSLMVDAASAHERGGAAKGHRMNFEAMDANGDGSLTEADIAAHAAERFATADTNGDGKLSVDEMQAAAEARKAKRHGNRASRMIERMDQDGDGMLTLAEMEGAMRGNHRGARMIERFDTDGDGAVSKAEFDAAADTHRKRGGHGKRHGD